MGPVWYCPAYCTVVAHIAEPQLNDKKVSKVQALQCLMREMSNWRSTSDRSHGNPHGMMESLCPSRVLDASDLTFVFVIKQRVRYS